MDIPEVYKDVFVPYEVQDAEMAAFLRTYLRVDDQSLDVIFIQDLTAPRKIVLYLLVAYVLKRLGKRDRSSVRPAEIARRARMNSNTVRVELRKLLRDEIVYQDAFGYFAGGAQDVRRAMRYVSA